MNTTSLLLPLLIAAIILGMLWVFYEQHKARKAVVGHIFAEFFTDTGASYEQLCKVDGMVVEAPSQSLVKHPEVTNYVVSADHTFDTLYPPGRPKILQATVQRTVYYEGNPNPQVSRERTGIPAPLLTDNLLRDLKNEQGGLALSRIVKEIEGRQAKAQTNPMLLGMLLILIVLAAVSIYMEVSSSSQLSLLLRLWGL